MTQQYIVGELSCLLAALESTSGPFKGAAASLRREIEACPCSMLAPLVDDAFTVADLGCWAALEQGDMANFRHCGEAAAALLEFADSANLQP